MNLKKLKRERENEKEKIGARKREGGKQGKGMWNCEYSKDAWFPLPLSVIAFKLFFPLTFQFQFHLENLFQSHFSLSLSLFDSFFNFHKQNLNNSQPSQKPKPPNKQQQQQKQQHGIHITY